MKWNRFTIKTKTEAEDIVICTLAEVGIEGVEIQDKQPLTDEDKAQMFVDIMPEGPADDGIAYLNFYLEEDADTEAILKDVKAALEDLRSFVDIGEATITESQTEDKDWINNWKQYFHPIPVGEKLLIRPLWEEDYDPQGRTVLHLEPGLAFGTGTHETTRLCLELLEKYVTPGIDFLDMGCGSGILSVAALLLGAKSAVGVDIDPLAVKTAVENAETNGVADRFTGICGNLAEKVTGKFQVVAANIVADIVILLSQDAPRFLNPDSTYIVSGIIDTREQDVLAAIQDTFQVIERREEKGWVAMALKLK